MQDEHTCPSGGHAGRDRGKARCRLPRASQWLLILTMMTSLVLVNRLSAQTPPSTTIAVDPGQSVTFSLPGIDSNWEFHEWSQQSTKGTLVNNGNGTATFTANVDAEGEETINYSLRLGRHYYGGHYYGLVQEGRDWGDARLHAENWPWLGAGGWYLATITSPGENAYVSNYHVPGGVNAWIGGNRPGATWIWDSGPERGQPITWANWAPGEPNNAGGHEHYVEFVPSGNANGRMWNDNTNSLRWFVIERDAYFQTYSVQIKINALPATSQVSLDRVHFQSAGQSMWTPGQGRLEVSKPLLLEWNTGIKTYGGFFNPGWNALVVLGVTIFPAGHLGETGVQARLGTSGRTGLIFHAWADGGSVNTNYPVTIRLEFPNKDVVGPNEEFEVKSAFTVDPTASLTTTSPSAGASLHAVFQSQNIAQVTAKALGATLLDQDFVPGPFRNVNIDHSVFDLQTELGTQPQKNFDLPSGRGILTGFVKVPRLSAAGGVENPATGTLRARSSDTFLTARGSITNLLSTLFPVLIPPTHLGFDESLNLGIASGRMAFQLSVGRPNRRRQSHA